MKHLAKLIHWMMPEWYEPGGKGMSKILTLGWGLFFTINLQIIFFVLFYLSDYSIGYIINVLSLFFSFIGIYFLKYTKHTRLAANITAGIIFFNTTINSYFTGGLGSSILLWILIIPIISIFILERKHGFYWVSVSLVALTILFVFFPKGSPGSIKLINNEHFDLWINIFLLGLIIWFSALVIDDAKNTAVHEAEKAKKIADENAKALGEELAQRKLTERALRESEEKLKHLANTDGLTKLINRRHFFILAEKELGRAARYQIPLSITIFDVDNFKSVNDQYGHLVGDQILFQVSKRCLEIIRNADILARYGGEEFVILFPHTKKEDAFASSERIRSAMEETPFLINNQEIWVTLSIGVAGYKGDRTPNIDALLELADKALYQSKRDGKNKTTMWEE
jgi:diguanylate cyclase (GGDEF)-like protein